jgi:lysosomal acid lipase/cholesteryl ester hydrolase
MPTTVPFIGRLHPIEYITLFVSLVILFLEGVIRLITLALPAPLINLCYRASRTIFHQFTTTTSALSTKRPRRRSPRHKAIVQQLVRAADFVELCEIYGYTAEEHVVQTTDGYLLGLHRLAWKKGEEDTQVNAGRGSVQKKVVFCMHGLLMNSEVWVCLTDKERCLPFALVDQGYDVWVSGIILQLLQLTTSVWKQSRQQILQEMHVCFPRFSKILGFLSGRLCLS